MRVDFVARPQDTEDIVSEVGELLVQAELHREGLQSSIVLVSDREARLVTLITLWDGPRFDASRARLTHWTQKLISTLTDGPIRTNTSSAEFLNPKISSKLTLADLKPDELAELVDIANRD